MDDPNKKESVADVLARMQAELSFDMESFEETGTAAPAAPKPAPQASHSNEVERRAMELVAKAESAVHATEQESDVNQYMDSLMNRYNQDGSQTPAPAPAPAKPAKPKAAVATAPPEEPVAVDMPQLLSHHEYLPQKKAPEEQASIAAMRELAVHSARRAIQDSVQRQRGLDASFRMSLGVGCALLAAGAFYFAEGFFTIMGMLGIASVVGATAFFLNWQSTVSQKPANQQPTNS